MSKSEFIRDTSIRLLSACLIAEELTLLKARKADRTPMKDLVCFSVDIAEELANELKGRGYMGKKPRSVIAIEKETTEDHLLP